jgi:hypothetical protein
VQPVNVIRSVENYDNCHNKQLIGFLTKDRFKNTDIPVETVKWLSLKTGHRRALFMGRSGYY